MFSSSRWSETVNLFIYHMSKGYVIEQLCKLHNWMNKFKSINAQRSWFLYVHVQWISELTTLEESECHFNQWRCQETLHMTLLCCDDIYFLPLATLFKCSLTENLFSLFFDYYYWCGVLCLNYYRAPWYRMRYIIIVLVERRCTGCKNKWSSVLENNVY